MWATLSFHCFRRWQTNIALTCGPVEFWNTNHLQHLTTVFCSAGFLQIILFTILRKFMICEIIAVLACPYNSIYYSMSRCPAGTPVWLGETVCVISRHISMVWWGCIPDRAGTPVWSGEAVYLIRRHTSMVRWGCIPDPKAHKYGPVRLYTWSEGTQVWSSEAVYLVSRRHTSKVQLGCIPDPAGTPVWSVKAVYLIRRYTSMVR